MTGEPVVINDLAAPDHGRDRRAADRRAGRDGGVLLLVFRGRPAAAAAAVALAAVGITFGLLPLAGRDADDGVGRGAADPGRARRSTTRSSSSRALGRPRLSAPARGEARAAVARRGRRGAPTLATAALATAAGFLVLELSPVPMVRGFGVLLVVGIAVALAVRADRRRGGAGAVDRGRRRTAPARRLRMRGGARRSGTRRLGDLAVAPLRWLGDRCWRRRSRRRSCPRCRRRSLAAASRPARSAAAVRAVAGSVRRPAPVVLALGAGAGGRGLGGRHPDPRAVRRHQARAAGQPALRDLRTLEHVTGVSGEIDVLVRADDVATPTVLRWMSRYQQRLLAHFGYRGTRAARRRRCVRRCRCPACSPALPGPSTERAVTPVRDRRAARGRSRRTSRRP